MWTEPAAAGAWYSSPPSPLSPYLSPFSPPSLLSFLLPPLVLLLFHLWSTFFTSPMFLLLFKGMWSLRMWGTACQKTSLSLFSLLLGRRVHVDRWNVKHWCLVLERTWRVQITSVVKDQNQDSSPYISEPHWSWDLHLRKCWAWLKFHLSPDMIRARFLRDFCKTRHCCLPVMRKSSLLPHWVPESHAEGVTLA